MPDVYVLRGNKSEIELARRSLSNFLSRIGVFNASTSVIRLLSKVNYLTGPSNITWFKAANYGGIKCYMPFLNPKLIHYLHGNYFSIRDILFPRYLLWLSLAKNIGMRRCVKYFFMRYGPFKIKPSQEIDNSDFIKSYNNIVGKWP